MNSSIDLPMILAYAHDATVNQLLIVEEAGSSRLELVIKMHPDCGLPSLDDRTFRIVWRDVYRLCYDSVGYARQASGDTVDQISSVVSSDRLASFLKLSQAQQTPLMWQLECHSGSTLEMATYEQPIFEQIV